MSLSEQIEATPGKLGESRVFRAGAAPCRVYGRFWWEACPSCGRRRWVRKAQRGRICCQCNALRMVALNAARREANPEDPRLGAAAGTAVPEPADIETRDAPLR